MNRIWVMMNENNRDYRCHSRNGHSDPDPKFFMAMILGGMISR